MLKHRHGFSSSLPQSRPRQTLSWARMIELLHAIEAIRAYDAFLSCATHALGRMALAVELYDSAGHLLSAAAR